MQTLDGWRLGHMLGDGEFPARLNDITSDRYRMFRADSRILIGFTGVPERIS